MKIIKKFRKISAQNYNDILKAEKKKGKKIIGYFCSYVPEEVIHAAGFIPYRMRAVESTGTGKGDVYYSSLNCTQLTITPSRNRKKDSWDATINFQYLRKTFDRFGS